jgi:carboxyl-terminal processing protease
LKAERWLVVSLILVMSAAGAGPTSYAGQASQASQAGRAAPSCAVATEPPGPLTPTTVDTIEQAYYCVLDHYYSGPALDDRLLLTAAFVGFTRELQRRGIEQSDATMPALTGNREGDWAAFSTVYRRVTDRVPADPDLRQGLADAAMNAMLAGLNDNHVRWMRPVNPPDAKPGDAYGIGVGLSGTQGAQADPVATAPLFVTSVAADSPAARQGVMAGDVIVSANGVPPFVNNVLSTGVLQWINQRYPQSQPVKLTLNRPATGRTWTATLKPELFAGAPPAVTSKLAGDIAYVTLPVFFPGVADQVLQAITKWSAGKTLRGVVIDVRGNGGGSPDEVNKLLGAFVHGKITAYHCDLAGACVDSRTDDTVPLLKLPLVTLTDRGCGSACEHFSAAVKDLRIGSLVGTRTAGLVSGPANGYVLSDNSLLVVPSYHHLGADHEMVDGIGVAPDHYVAQTAHDRSTGRDPVLAKALSLF